jgi:NADPH:quinone reductase-like Zn-dependent oxidoreductase
VPTARIVFEEIVVRGFTRLWTLRQMGRDQGRAFLRELAGMVMDGRLTSAIEAVYPLSEISPALRHAEQQGRDGKVVLVMGPAGP